jgi:hypothetical protein
MIARLRTWWRRKLLDWAQRQIESYGLTVVKLHTVAGTTYLVNADGSAMRLAAVGKRK